MLSTEEFECKLVDSFGCIEENVSKLTSEAVFRSSRFAEVGSSSIFVL